MEMKSKTNLDWTKDKLLDILIAGREAISKHIEAEGIADDEDAVAAIKDYEEGPRRKLCDEGFYESLIINACLDKNENGAVNPIDVVLFHFDPGQSHKKNCAEAKDAWKDEPYGETVPAPIASSLKFGKEGMNVSWATRLMWLIVVLVLNWMAWAIIG